MAPSTLQARIHAFETLASSPYSKSSQSNYVSKSPPDLLESPTIISPVVPLAASNSSPSPSPPNLGRKTSLIDLKDWVVDDGPMPYVPRQKKPINGKPSLPSIARAPPPRHTSDPVVHPITPLINLEAAPNPRPVPPLPPRKPSYNSLRSVSASNSSSSSLSRSPNFRPVPSPGSPSVQLPTRTQSDSLTVDHTYPPFSKLGISIPTRGHVPASSISSFHSVSLSSDGGSPSPGNKQFGLLEHEEHGPELDTVSLDESFENVSATAYSPSVSSLAHDWETPQIARPVPASPPKLPQRPKPSPQPTATTSGPARTPKPKPPPPPRPPSHRASLASTTASDRSSTFSTATTATSFTSAGSAKTQTQTQPPQARLARPTPVPAAARRRYEAVFVRNVLAARPALLAPPGRKTRQAAGWRGLSVDLITNPEEMPTGAGAGTGTGTGMGTGTGTGVEEDIGPEERLDGQSVKLIWTASKLERARLREIWHECDTEGVGSLDRDAFVKGMWRIDEELRRMQLTRQGLSSNASLRRVRQPKLILR